jgi:hypothetical protein
MTPMPIVSRAVAGLWLICASAAPAGAYPVILTLQNVAFSDGGVATGTIELNVLGFLSGGEISTTDGSLLAGSDYAYPGNPSGGFADGVYSTFDGAYDIALFLDLAQPFTETMSGVDLITGGCETHSFATGCDADVNTRLIVLGNSPELVVREPVSIAVLGSGLVALLAARSRRERMAG